MRWPPRATSSYRYAYGQRATSPSFSPTRRAPSSRAGRRPPSLLVARKQRSVDESPRDLIGLAEAIRAARLADRAGGLPASLPASQGSNGGRSPDCLAERIREARERVRRTQGPGDYVLGSPQSRAAARAVLARRFAEREKFDLVVSSTIPRPRGDGIRIGKWSEGEDGRLTRVSFLPMGMTIEEAERIVAADQRSTR